MNIDNTNITNTNNNKYSKTSLTAKQSNIVDDNNINNTNDNNQLEILFLDTFSLANFDNEFNDPLNNNNIRKEPNIGLIQFQCPVIVDEIRIIPLSTVVSCENLRSVHLGATIPSSFDIHFYVNELKAKESSTFLDIGCFAYKEHGNHTFKSTKSVATDGLLICGYFQSVTIAVLGRITSLSSLKESTTAASATATEKLSSNDHSDDDNDLNSDDNPPKLSKNIVVDIKEPDDFNEKPQIDDQPNTADPSLYPRVDNDDDDDSDVHSLSSPSPSTTNVCARILSPSPSRTPPLPPQIIQQSHSRIRNTKNDNDTIDSDIDDDDDKSSKRYDFYRQRHRRSLSKSSSNQSPDSHVVNVKSRVLKPQSYDDDDDDGVDLNSSTNRHRISEPHQYRSDRYNDDNNDGSPSSPYGSRYYSSTSSASITSKDYYYHHHHHRLRSSPSTSKSTSSMKYRHNVLKYEHHHHYRSHSKDRDYDRDGHNDYDDRVYHSSYRSSSKNRRNQPNDYDDDDVGGDDGHGGGAGIIDHRKHYHHPKQHQYLHHQHRYDRRSISAERQNRESSLNRYGGHKHSYHQPNIKLKNQRNSSSHNDDNDDLDYTHRSSLSKLRTSTSGGSNSGHNIDSNNSDNNRDNISHVNNSPKSSSSSTTTPHKYRDYHHDNFQHRQQQPKSCESRERSISPTTTPPIVNYRNNKRDNDDRSSESRESSLMSDMQPPLRKKSKSTAVADADVEMIQSPCDDPDDDHSLSSPISTHNDKQVKIGNKMEIECIRSPGSPSDDDDSKNSEQILLKSTNMVDEAAAAAGGGGGQSPHSSISSSVSLDPFEPCDQSKSKPIKSAETEEDDSKSGAKELFEPLSGSDIDDNDANNDDGNDNDLNFDDNFERISTSSDDDVGDFNETIDDSIANDDDHDDLKNKKTELEVISSDEEYPDNDNTTSSTLLQQSATTDNLNDNDNSNVECANINDDDDDDTIFLMTNNKMERNHRYNPMEANQLKILEFPLNNDTMKTSLMDWKIFNEIYKFLKDNFSHIYAINDGDNDTDNSHNKKRIDSIQNEWVKNVEILAMKIMKLKCPIYYEQFNETVKTDDHIDFNDDRNIKDFIRILISIINDGLDFNLAILQQQTPYKIRHIKAGIKLLISVFSSFDLRIAQSSMKFNDNGDLIEKLLNENFPYKLLKLYEIPYQSLSIRLLILNGLLVITDHLKGLKYICEQEFDWSLVKQYEDYQIHSIDDTPSNNDTLRITNGTCYQYLLTLIMNNKQTRLTSIFEELLLKIHMFEVFDEFNCINIDHDNLTEINFAKIKSILLEICKYFRTISNRIHRPLRLMNNICQYEIKTTVNASIPLLLLSSSATSSTNSTDQNYDQLIENRFSCPQTNCTSSRIGYVATKLFYKFFEHFNILGKFIRLLSLYKVSMNKNEILAEICDQILHLFNAITLHQQGLKFLLANRLNVDQMNSLHSLLIDFGQPDLPENCEFVNLGLKLITRLRTFNLIDEILNNIYEYRLKQSLNNDENDTIVEPTRNSSVINSLLQLFMMIMYKNYQYRYEILQILTMEHNFDSIQSLIMPILQQFDQQNNKNSSNNIKRIQMDRRLDIVALIYAIKLSIECIRYLPEKNLQHFVEIYGKSMVKTIEYCQRFIIIDQSTNQTSSLLPPIKSYNRTDSIIQYYLQKYSTLNDWLRPIANRNDSPSLSINNINNQMDELILSKFIGILKKCTDSFHEISQKFENQYERIYNLKPEVILSIKFLLTYCDPCIGEGRNLQPELQLKYKYSIVICYNCDCLQHLLSILTAIIETLERPSHAIYLRTKNDSYINLYCKNYSKLSSRNDSDNNNPDNSNQSNSTATTKFDRQQLQRYSDSIMNQGSLIMEFIRPSIRFLQLILDYLIESYGHNFKDSTPVPILLRLYNLLSLFMTNIDGNNMNESMKSIQKQIIDIIGSIYTKIYRENPYKSSLDTSKSSLTTVEMMNNVNKSVWTKMLKHVFEFTIKAPRYFQCGLEILSKILPPSLPLPYDKCSPDENYEKNYRKLWSLHLCCLNHEFEQLYEMFILSNNVNIQKLLRNVTYKLFDLSTTIVIENVMKKLLEILIGQISMIILDRKFKATINEHQNIDTIGNNLNADNYNYVYNYNNLKKIFNFILDLYAKSLPFRIGLLNLIYCFITINSIDPMYKESKILKFFQQTYHYLNQRKFQQHNLIMVKKDLIVEILTSIDENLINGDNNDGENLIFYQYFANENEKLLQIMKNFQFSDKILQKFIHLCNETIGKYFEQRIVFIDDPNPDEEMFNDQTGDQEAMETVPIQAAIMNEIVFDERFIRMSKYFHLPEEWPSLSNVDQDNVTGLATMNDKKKFDYQDLIKNYLKLEMDKFMRIIDTLYLPIIMQPESKNTENNSDPDGSLLKLNTANNNGLTSLNNSLSSMKRSTIRSGRGRGAYGHRGTDPFRSRPPNTSRPPSMHVDDFVAMEQRTSITNIDGTSSSSSSMLMNNNKNRQNHLLLLSSSSSTTTAANNGSIITNNTLKHLSSSSSSIPASTISTTPASSSSSSMIDYNLRNNNSSSSSNKNLNLKSSQSSAAAATAASPYNLNK